MNLKPLVVFIVIAYVGYLLGGYLVDYLAPMLPSIFTGFVGDAIRFALPTAVVFLGWQKFGKKG